MYAAVVDAIIKDGAKRRAGGILPPYDTETLLVKLSEVSDPTKTLIRKLTGVELDDCIEIHKPTGEQVYAQSWCNFHATLACQSSFMQLLFSFDQDMRVDETLMQTLACQLSCNSCSRLTRTRELMKLSCKLSLVNSRTTLVLVWPGHESWWKSHANSRLFSLVVVAEDEVKKTEPKLKKLNLSQCKLSYGKNVKFLWIRVALVEKLLAKILASLVEHARYVVMMNHAI